MRLIAITTALAIAFVASPAIRAQEPDAARQELATQFVRAMRAEQTIDQFAGLFFQSIAGSYRAQLASVGTCPAAEQTLDAQAAASRELMVQAFKEGDFVGKSAQIYARAFTDAELRDAIAFFNSPTGQKFLDKQPQLMQEGAVLGQALMMAKQDELRAMSTRLGGEMKAALDACGAAKQP